MAAKLSLMKLTSCMETHLVRLVYFSNLPMVPVMNGISPLGRSLDSELYAEEKARLTPTHPTRSTLVSSTRLTALRVAVVATPLVMA